MKKTATKRALFMSALSLLLCVSMLVGTTYAWFTDEVESGRNTIAAGNLDVELYHSDDNEGVITENNKVGSTTMLFNDEDDALWEPGKVVYENLQVKNVGSLALKYALNLDVLNETEVNGHKLSEVIKVGVIHGGVADDSNRADVISQVGEYNWTSLEGFNLDSTGALLANGYSQVVGVVLYWEPNNNDVDNLYNINNGMQGVLQLDIGVTLVATQYAYEEDSFDENYDQNADYTDPSEPELS